MSRVFDRSNARRQQPVDFMRGTRSAEQISLQKWQNGWSATATFEGEFSNVTTSYAGKGVVRYSW